MAASSPGRFSSTFLRVLAACAAGGVAAALVDVVLAAARASDPIGAGPLARDLVAAIGLWAAAAIPVGAIAGLVAASVRCAFPAGWLAGAWRSLRAPDGDERDAIAAAALLASGV